MLYVALHLDIHRLSHVCAISNVCNHLMHLNLPLRIRLSRDADFSSVDNSPQELSIEYSYHS